MLGYIENFQNDYLDGKVTKDEYPNAYTYAEAIQNTTDRFEREMESDDVGTMLVVLTKIASFAAATQLGHKNKDYVAVSKAVEEFTGVSMDIELVREEFKTYAKNQIDKL